MSRIERREFQDLAQSYSIDTSAPSEAVQTALRDTGIPEEDLRSIAGSDRVINGSEEFARLYDRLEELDRRRPIEVNGARLDRAARLYEALNRPAAGPRGSSGDASPVGIGGSGRRGPQLEDPTPRVETPVRTAAHGTTQVGSGRDAHPVDAQVVVPTAVDERLAALRAQPTTTSQGGMRAHSLDQYLRTVEAFESGARGRVPGHPPEGVPADLWNLRRALELQNISADDVRVYAATGQLPDLVDAQGQTLRTGAERMEALHRAATREGSWPAVNSLTFLVGARRSAMAAERTELQGQLAALPADAANRAELQGRIDGLSASDQALSRGMQAVYTSATYARERTGQALVTRGGRLDQQAAQARGTGDTVRAAELERRATELRDRGARIAHAEGTYRAGMRGTGWDASSAFLIAADAQVARGRAEVADQVRTGRLTGEPPASLGNAVDAGNGVPGAERVLGEARASSRTRGRDQRTLSIEGQRQDALATFHGAHLERGGYFRRGDANTPPPARSRDLLAHREAYVDARASQAVVDGQRLELYGPPSQLSGPEALDAARLTQERRRITEELSGAIGQSLDSARQAGDARTRRDEIRASVREARSIEADSGRDVGLAREGETRATDANRTVIDLRGSGEARRDGQEVSDTGVIRRGDEARAQFATRRREALERVERSATAEVGRAEALATRDAQDADIVGRVLARRPGLIPDRPGTAAATYRSLRAEGDRLATSGADFLSRAETQLPTREPARTQGQLEIAGARLDVAGYLTRSTELDARALGDDGRRGATARLDRAGALIDRADTTRAALPADHPGRTALATGVIDARAGLAEANSDYRPGVARDQLARAERVMTSDLGGNEALRQDARGRIGSAAVSSLVRSDLRFGAILSSGGHDATAQDALYAQGHRMLDDRRATGEGVGRARDTLREVDRNLDAVAGMLDTSGVQLRNGLEYSTARTRSMSNSEILAAQAQVSTVISGGAYVLTLGNVDMKEEMANAGEDALRNRTSFARQSTDRLVQGQGELSSAWRQARSEGRSFEFLGSLRIFSDRGNREAHPEAYQRAFQFIDSRVPASAGPRTGLSNWQDFNRVAIRGDRRADENGHMQDVPGASPLARALTGPVLGFRGAEEAYGDRRIGIITGDMQDMMASQASSLQETTRNMGWIIAANVSLEVALGIVLTGGVGSAGAVAEAGNAANAARTGLEAASAVRSATMLARAGEALQIFRAAHPVLYTMGVGTAVGAGMMGVSMGARRMFGEHSGAARLVDVATNFIPIGAGHRAAGLGAAADRAILGGERAVVGGERAVVGAERATTRLGQVRQALISHARFYGPQLALGGGQAFATSLAVPALASSLGIRSETGQAALGLALGALMSGGIAAGMARRPSTPAARAEALVPHLQEIAPGADRRAIGAARGQIESFLRSTEGRVPAEAESAALRRSLYERLGVPERGGDSNAAAQRQLIDGAVEALRVERAGQITVRELSRGSDRPLDAPQAQRAVELAAERLYQARGGEGGGASRVQAWRDAAMFVSDHVGSGERAQPAVRDAAIDRARAAEIAEGFSVRGEGAPVIASPEQRGRVERVLTEELGGLRRSLETEGGRGPADASGGPSAFERLSARLQREGGLSREGAESVLRSVQADIVERGSVARLAEAQSRSAVPLSEEQIRTVVEDVATRAGTNRETARAVSADMAAAPGVRDWLLGVSEQRWNALSPADRQRTFLEMHPAAGDLGNLTPQQFRDAFGDGPYHPQLAELAHHPGFDQFAIQHPAEAGALYRAAVTGRDVGYSVSAHLMRPGMTFTQALRDFRAALPTETGAQIPTATGPVAYRRVTAPQGSENFPALRLAPGRDLDHNGAFMQFGQVPGRASSTRWVPTSEGRNAMFIRPEQLVLEPANPRGTPPTPERRATGADWQRIAVFGGHGAPDGFSGPSASGGMMATADAARAMARELSQYNGSRGGRPAVEFVVIEACSQGDRRGFLGLSGETNAAEFQRVLNAELAAQGQPPVRVLAAREAGPLYGGASHGTFFGGRRPAEFVTPDRQTGAWDGQMVRTRLLLGGGMALGTAAVGGLTYVAVDQARERDRDAQPRPRREAAPERRPNP